MIISITAIFFLSWLPLTSFRLAVEVGLVRRESVFSKLSEPAPICAYFPPKVSSDIMSGGGAGEAAVYAVLHLLGLANACINPILYGYLNETFRKEYRTIYR